MSLFGIEIGSLGAVLLNVVTLTTTIIAIKMLVSSRSKDEGKEETEFIGAAKTNKRIVNPTGSTSILASLPRANMAEVQVNRKIQSRAALLYRIGHNVGEKPKNARRKKKTARKGEKET